MIYTEKGIPFIRHEIIILLSEANTTTLAFLHMHVEPPYSFYTRLRQEEPITFSPTLNAYLVEGRIAFEALTQRIPNMRLVPDQQFTYTFNPTAYGYTHLYVEWD